MPYNFSFSDVDSPKLKWKGSMSKWTSGMNELKDKQFMEKKK